jgi:hypothetical protein
MVRPRCQGRQVALNLKSGDNSFDRLPRLPVCFLIRMGSLKRATMAKRKKGSKVQSRAKLRRATSAKRSKGRKVAKIAKRAVAKAKPKPAPVKKVARKAKRPIAPVVETVVAEVIEQPAPGVTTVTEVEETEVRKAS